MAFVDVGVGAAALFGAEGLSTAAAGAIGSGLVGAGAGALINGLSGRSVLNGALMGGALGAIGGGIGGSFMGAGADVTGQIGSDIASMQAAGASSTEISQALMDTYGMTAEQAATTMSQVASTGTTAGGINMGTTAAQQLQAANMVKNVAGSTDQPQAQPTQTSTYTPQLTPSSTSPSAYTDPYAAQDVMQQARDASVSAPTPSAWNTPTSGPSMFSQITDYMKKNPGLTATAAGAAILASQGKKAFQPNYLPAYTPQSAASMGLNRTLSANYQPTRPMATGGIADLTAAGETGLQSQPQQTQSQPVTMDYIKSLANQYGVSLPTKSAASGGSMGKSYNLGSYSDGGRLLKGPGDGMSDNIPATIADKQPARLADGEFVVPADVVSHLGNGSTDAGAKHLYKMMDNVRKARTGRNVQGKQIKADKYLPK